MISFWEKKHLVDFDVVIVGGGIVGMSTAISLKEWNPDLNIAIIERGILPSGASTKNAGFACFGSLSELVDDEKHVGIERTLETVELRWKGLQLLKKRIGEKKLGYCELGSYEMLEDDELNMLNHMERFNDLLEPIIGKTVYERGENVFGFDKDKFPGVVKNNYEGQLNTGMMINELLALVNLHGIRLISGTEFMSYKNTGEKKAVTLRSNGNTLEFGSKVLVFATNAFTHKFIPELEMEAGRGQVIVTNEIPGLRLKGIFHFDKGYHYFRNVGNRILYGGGRNAFKEEERTTEFGSNEEIRSLLVENLKNWIIPGIEFTVEHSWSGIMAFGKDKYPIIKEVEPGVYVAAKLGGIGVAAGSEVGEMTCRLIKEGSHLNKS